MMLFYLYCASRWVISLSSQCPLVRLSDLVATLRHQHEGFERASAEEWSNPTLATEKRKFRQNRQACVLQINVVLAEMGELDLVNEIQKLSFERRIQRLEEYLASSAGMM